MTAVTIHHLHTHLRAATRTPSEATATWRWEARRMLAEVRDLLLAESTADADSWLSARWQGMERERSLLLVRLSAAARRLHEPAVERIRVDLDRLLVDVDHHLQRRRDLAWDEVELELGGSE